jgi:hypothetical protein
VDSVTAVYSNAIKNKSIEFDDQSKLRLDSDADALILTTYKQKTQTNYKRNAPVHLYE